MIVEDFGFLAGLVRDRAGIVLGQEKSYLVNSRMAPLLRQHSLPSVAALCARLRARREPALELAVVEAMTTNESFFFRDGVPFHHFRHRILPHLLRSRAASRHIRIWSAACSSGQEPYSLAMILAEERAKLAGWKIDLLATDLSGDILARAASATYSQFEIDRGMTPDLLGKYFRQDGENWVLTQEIRSMVRFARFNLLDAPAPLGVFDVVFCRNVLIYFDQDTKRQVLERIRGQVHGDGYLILGGAETVLGVTEAFVPATGGRGLYVAAGEAAAPTRAFG